jgi:hypothetical protein
MSETRAGERGRVPTGPEALGQGALVAEEPLQQVFVNAEGGERQGAGVATGEVAVGGHRGHVLNCVREDASPRLLAEALPVQVPGAGLAGGAVGGGLAKRCASDPT